MITAIRARKLARVGARVRAGRMKARAPLRALKSLQPFKFLTARKKFPLHNFEPKVRVYQTSENFILKTADSPFELRQVLKLRHDIFYREMQNKEAENSIDIDDFDAICDHLIIIDRSSSKVVGTYRVISSTFSDKFYSAGEFHIEEFLKAPGNKLELGRACIHKEFRTGAIINLLWKGICEYIKKTDTQYLFGCASVQTVEPSEAAKIMGYLGAQNLLVNDFNIQPTPKYLAHVEKSVADETTADSIPALIQSYVKAGAKFYGNPAFDKDFQCFDFFMALNVNEMNRLFRRRFGLDK